MQDRFKFRGINCGKWYYGGYFKHLPYTPYCCSGEIPEKDYKHLIINEGFSDWGMPRNMMCIDVEPDSIGQCTGLKDKNGKLIYEGDIVKITKEDWRKDLYSLVYVVCWDMTQWQLGLLKYQRPKAQANRRSDRTFPFKNIVSFNDYTPKKNFAQCEIIGNVYENKELLESNHETS